MSAIVGAKLTALREALERDGEVRFKNGSLVTREVDHVEVSDAEPGADGEPATEEVVTFVVRRPAGGIATYNEGEVSAAYRMALDGPRPKAQPSGTGSMFGDDPPF